MKIISSPSLNSIFNNISIENCIRLNLQAILANIFNSFSVYLTKNDLWDDE